MAAISGYAFEWLRFSGRNLLFVAAVALLVVPLQVTLVPLLRLFNGLGLTSTFVGIRVVHAGFGLPSRSGSLLTAAAFVSSALPLVLFLGPQRYFVRGIVAGSVKS